MVANNIRTLCVFALIMASVSVILGQKSPTFPPTTLRPLTTPGPVYQCLTYGEHIYNCVTFCHQRGRDLSACYEGDLVFCECSENWKDRYESCPEHRNVLCSDHCARVSSGGSMKECREEDEDWCVCNES